MFRPHLLVAGERLVSTVIEYHAVHQHLDDRQAVVLQRPPMHSVVRFTSASIERAKKVPWAPITVRRD